MKPTVNLVFYGSGQEMFLLQQMQPTISLLVQCFWIYKCQKTGETALDDSGIKNVWCWMYSVVIQHGKL